MEKIKRLLPLLFLFIIIAAVYRVWFGTGILSGGDLGMTFHSMYFNDYLYPFAWYWNQGVGLGGNAVSLLWIYVDFAFTKTIFGQILGLPWNIAERLAYFFPFLILGLPSSFVLAKSIFPKNPFLVASALIFLVNSYILMVVGGGQLWIFLSYAITPFVLYLFIKEINSIIDLAKWGLRKPFFIGLIFSLQFLLDLRIAYITLFAAFFYWLFKILQKRKIKDSLISLTFVFLIPGILTLLIHGFWILPTLIIGQNPLSQFGSAFTSANAVSYFSFAKLENSISLLHPNWPENIFGKVGFMKSEFLLSPILAFSSLFFSYKTKDQITKSYVLFFAFLGLIGAFLAKGVNDPLGGIYLWMFSHVPGFIMFRDPTKWYTLVAVSYSILIPFTLWRIYEWLKSKNKFSILKCKNLFLIFVGAYFLFLINPALSGQLGGTFKTTQIPNEYFNLESFFSSQNRFFRTFWLPTVQRFGLNSKDHPAISGQDLLGTYDLSSAVNKLKTNKDVLRYSSVGYLVVPYDSEDEIFIKDRKYNKDIYQKTINEVKQIPYLKQISGFGRIAVFEVPNPKDHFWSMKEGLIESYKYINPVKYIVNVKNAKKGDVIVFAENYNPKWVAINDNIQINSKQYDKLFNSFTLLKNGNYELEVYYTPQKYVDLGLAVSLATLVSIVVFFILSFKRSKSK